MSAASSTNLSSGDWPAIIACVLPVWMEMHTELCQPLHQSSPKDWPTSPEPRGRTAGQEASLVLPAQAWRSLGLQEQVSEMGSTTGQRKHSPLCNGYAPQMEERNCTPLGSGAVIARERRCQHDGSQVPCTSLLCQITSLFPPPIKQRRHGPCRCRDLHELQQPRSQGCRNTSPLGSAPRFFPPKECTLSCHLQVFTTASAQCSPLASNTFSFRSN